MDTVFFNAHHAPAGAFFTLTLGSKGARGGLGCEIGKPADQNLYIALESTEKGVFEALPFYEHQASAVESFGIAEVRPAAVTVVPFSDNAITRTFTPCSDVWNAGSLLFSIYSPVYHIPDPDDCDDEAFLKVSLMPAVAAECTVDNRTSAVARRLVVGWTADDSTGMRHIAAAGMTGVGQGRRFALCTSHADAVSGIGFTAEEIIARNGGGFGLGTTALLCITVPAGALVTVPLVFCCYREGYVTAGIDGKYTYTRYFTSVDDVARYALERMTEVRDAAAESDRQFCGGKLSPERNFMLAQAIRSYYGSTQCIDTADGVRWIVNEGEYRMINTLDLAADHLFFELMMHPWVVRSIARMYRNYYARHDDVQQGNGADGMVRAGGISFTHDMGVANVFSAPGTSAYEQQGCSGCFSYMTHEELVNWILIATVYVLHTGDTVWAEEFAPVFEACCTSLVNRDDVDLQLRRGYMQHDSILTGSGSEITTYDSLDESLGRARSNSYGAVRRWAAFILLEKVFAGLANIQSAHVCSEEADRTAAAIVTAQTSDGLVPSFLDGTVSGTALAVIEGLVYPWFAGCREVFTSASRFAPMIAVLRGHCSRALSPAVCINVSGAWMLSSSSNITWLSKLYLCRFIATDILGISADDRFFTSDKSHCGWLTNDTNSCFAWSDQFRDGVTVGSRYYPRGVTAVLWLLEKDAGEEGAGTPLKNEGTENG